MEKLSFDSFTKKIYINTTKEKLYWCWATPEGICSWFLRKAQYFSPEGERRNEKDSMQIGDSYIWEWHNWDDQEKGQVIRNNGMDFLEISFTDSKVSVQIESQGNACLLTLKQYDIPTDEESRLNIHYGCSNGWTFWLANLKAYLEHGILLNETERDLRNIPLVGFEFVNL
ncbi:SRPBCC family protein [Ulvibacterium sp.]|uniref:SRPBCC family protein n=1 Tax=Ulvibacterium sp. TaxID=2665914 RepID=UPI003CC5B23E